MARITDEKVLLERVKKFLPKGIPETAIESVEVWEDDPDLARHKGYTSH